jgi:hypothetical protein
VIEHVGRGQQQRAGVGDALAGDVRRGAMDGFENGCVLADVVARRVQG